MKKISKVLSIVVAFLFLSATYSHAEEPTIYRYVQLKDGVVFAYVESTKEVANSILLPAGVTWDDVKRKKYENGTFVDATIIKTVTEIVDNKVAQTSTTVFASDAKGDVVSSDVQLGWNKNNSGTYTSSSPQPSEPPAGSFNRTTIETTGTQVATVLVNIVGAKPVASTTVTENTTVTDDTTVTDNTTVTVRAEPVASTTVTVSTTVTDNTTGDVSTTVTENTTVTTFNGAAAISVNEKSHSEITTHVQPNGLKVTEFVEETETASFDAPKTIEEVESSLNDKPIIKRYLTTLLRLLNGWLLVSATV
jgi:hypothetical protein